VPGGTFYRSYDGISPYNKMDYPASVSTFALDKYEVTVGRYRAFVAAKMATSSTPPAAGSGAHPLIPGSGWNPIWNFLFDSQTIGGMTGPTVTWTDAIGPNENLPMNCVPWYKAFAFCIWDGGRLPTEAEWNYAAAGGDEQREYPWGSAAPDASLAVFNCQAVGDAGCALTDLLPVGSKPAGNGKYGHADLAGSLWELVLDQYGSYPVPCSDCAAVPSDKYPNPVHRGGSYEDAASWIRTAAARIDGSVLQQTSDLGFRCARAAQ
jgi:formylglycine-generating enzyme required for sulfatase activity